MRISYFLQTPFISYDDKNMLYITVSDWDMCNPYEVSILINGETKYREKIFAPEFSAMIPCYNEEQKALIRIIPFEDTPIEGEFSIVPQKHWEIPLLYSSHEDLGYCAYVEKLHYECYEYLKKAMELCEKHEGFKYMIEHYWWLDAFDSCATEDEKEELERLFKEKKIDLSATHSGVHTSWANSEQLVREMYFGCLEAKEKYDISPQCAFYVDISGASWSVVNAYAKMGIKYMGILPNGFRNSDENAKIPPIFWWEDKSGEEKLLVWYQRAYRQYGLSGIWCDTLRQYPEGSFYFDTTKILKTEKWLSKRISSCEPCPYDILPISFYDDREMPTTMLLTVCEEMNKKWKYPKFSMEIPTVFMSKIAEKYGDAIPCLRGDISDQWADFATIAPNMTAKKREAMRKLYHAEMLSSLDMIKNKAKYHSKAFRDIYFKLSEFDEHCWATSSKHPQKMHKHNIDTVKRKSVELSLEKLDEILNTVCPRAKGEEISVVNTLPKKRKSRIIAEKNSLIPKDIDHQILPNGAVVTEEIELDGVCSKNFESVIPYKQSKEIDADYIETDYFRITLNKTTKKIVSIVDKTTDIEYIDKGSRFELGQFIYAYCEGKTDSHLSYEVPKKTEFKIYDGEIAYAIVQKGYEEQSGANVTAQLVFYKHDRTIDIDLSYENAKGLIGDFYDRYKKNYFFAFPFSIENPEFYTEMPVGEKNEAIDYIPLNANDFSVTQSWIAIEGENNGVAIYTRDMPVFHLGGIKYNQFKSDFCAENSCAYLYASSNRCNNLIYDSIEECYAKYRLSVLLYNGKHNGIAPVWSRERDCELLISKKDLIDGCMLNISEPNVRLVSMKKSEDSENSVILRLVETDGKKTECEAEVFFDIKAAMYTSNDERELEKIDSIEGNRVRFNISPYSYTTVKLYKA